jgi:anti-sigma regulatory factor (Ser/Thr protein kinase)
VGALTASFDLPLGLDAPSAARHAVGAVLYGWGFQDRQWLLGAQLVVSELVANAVLHGGGCLELTVAAHDATVAVAVADGSSVVPRRRDADENGGRGLVLIEAFSDGWGVHDHEGGKRVWVQLTPCPDWLFHESR